MPILPIALFLSFLILLCVFFVGGVLVIVKKVGFLETVKSKIAGVIVWIAICVGLPALLFVWGSLPRSGNQLFKDFIMNPVPKSVEVLNRYDGDVDFNPNTCLHFKTSPTDFQLILASKKWETVSEAPFISLECNLRKSPWGFTFPPPSLGGNVITYTFIPREGDVEIMFTNTQMNEVYYFKHNGNAP